MAGRRISGSTDLLKMLLVAHLLIEPSASELWTCLREGPGEANTPSALDQIDSQKTVICARLNSIAMAIRSRVDLSKFEANLIGDAGHEACMLFDLSHVEFANPTEIAGIATTIANQHDGLLSRLDASGRNVAGMERRLNCWDSFIGPVGRNKDVGLFYIFVLFEGEEIRWVSRRLPDGYGANSQSTPLRSTISNESKSSGLTSRDRGQVDYLLSQLPIGGPAQRLPVANEGESVQATQVSRKRLYDARSRVQEQTELSIQATRVEQSMHDPFFSLLAPERQEEIKENWFANLRDGSAPLRK